MNLLIVRNNSNSQAIDASLLLATYLGTQGIGYAIFDSSDLEGLDPNPLVSQQLARGVELAVVLGGDGTILRTADAFECDGVFLVNACADLFNPKTARATMGAIFRREAYSVTPEELFALLSKSGVPLYGTALREDTVPLSDANLSKAAVAIGSEGRGLSQQMLDECAKTLKIPMSPRCESLNAAIAATVVLWEMYR